MLAERNQEIKDITRKFFKELFHFCQIIKHKNCICDLFFKLLYVLTYQWEELWNKCDYTVLVYVHTYCKATMLVEDWT
jgi:hypothetical protein